MYIGEWIGSSLGFIVVMLGAMGIAVGLVVHAALATMRGYVVDEAPEATPAVPRIRSRRVRCASSPPQSATWTATRSGTAGRTGAGAAGAAGAALRSSCATAGVASGASSTT